MRVLVTGATGFVGRHLVAHLRERGDEVTVVGGPRDGAAQALRLDVTDAKSVDALLEQAVPEGVIHLAGFASVGKSHAAPAEAFAINALGTVNVLAAARARCPKAKLLLVGSGETYGPIATGIRAHEAMPPNPTSPYASGKVAAEIAGIQFSKSYGLSVVLARPFNHLGAGQDAAFVVPAFAAQLRAIARGDSEPVIRVGDLSPVRDFSHVEDVVAGYRLLLERGVAGEAYNLCSGVGRTIRSVLDELVELSGVKAEVVVDPQRLRPAEIPALVGDPGKIERLGWTRRKTVRDALADALQGSASAER